MIKKVVKKGGEIQARPEPCKVQDCHAPRVVRGGVRRERPPAGRTGRSAFPSFEIRTLDPNFD